MEELTFIAILIAQGAIGWGLTGSWEATLTQSMIIGPVLGVLGYLAIYRLRTGDWGIENW